MRARSWLLVLLWLSGAVAWAQVPVRVLLGEVGGALEVTMPGAHRGYLDAGPSFATAYGLSWPLTARGDTLYLDDEALAHALTLEPTDGGLMSYQGKSYRGGMRLIASEGRILIVNVLDLEEYLRGVVPAEMQASWPLEALKAQAVAARSYALTELAPEADYDICATVECQHYGGAGAEHARSDQAVLETAGQVITYGGRVATAYYHADSGGMLASGAEVWGDDEPYLPAQPDVPSSSPHGSWRYRLEPAAVAASLRAKGYDLGEVTGLRVLAYSDSGRVAQAEVQGARGSAVLEGPELTKLLRDWGLKSTRFSMAEPLVAVGHGWGHGVGMSQYGALALAQAGYGYQQILAFYYPSTALQKLAVTAAAPASLAPASQR